MPCCSQVLDTKCSIKFQLKKVGRGPACAAKHAACWVPVQGVNGDDGALLLSFLDGVSGCL